MNIKHHNPDSLIKNPAFSQAVSVQDATRMIYVGGQEGVSADGAMAEDDISAQSEQALRNVLEVLKAAGATQEDVVKMNIFVVHGQDVRAAYAAAQRVWGSHPTAITVLLVAGLAVPGALVEIDAVAAIDK